jgi:nucleotide-binding universal stress UspA family protein
MNTTSRSILLVTNGAKESLPALEHGAWLAGKLIVPVRLLGIYESKQAQHSVAVAVQKAQDHLDELGVAYKTQLERGEIRQVICRLADPQKNLVVFGPSSRPRWLRWLRGGRFRRIFKDIDTPLVYVPASRHQINKILVCMGGLSYSRSVEHWAIYLSQHTSASITILHVVESIYYQYPTAVEIQTHWQELLSTDTPQARNLNLAVEIAEAAGIPVEIKERHGDVIYEILAELEAGQYDLIALGTQQSGRSLCRKFTPNVTAEVAEAVSLPVLTAHTDQELIFE